LANTIGDLRPAGPNYQATLGREPEVMMMYWNGSGMNGWGYLLMTVSMVLFWGLVIAGVVLLVRNVGNGARQTSVVSPTPQRVLADRFARGEIDEQEYQRRLGILHADVTLTPH
jgi:putative membrane protein